MHCCTVMTNPRNETAGHPEPTLGPTIESFACRNIISSILTSECTWNKSRIQVSPRDQFWFVEFQQYIWTTTRRRRHPCAWVCADGDLVIKSRAFWLWELIVELTSFLIFKEDISYRNWQYLESVPYQKAGRAPSIIAPVMYPFITAKRLSWIHNGPVSRQRPTATNTTEETEYGSTNSRTRDRSILGEIKREWILGI